jgi:hypothetical protein
LTTSAPAAQSGIKKPVSWADKPMRWGQLTLVDNDPGQYDATWWIGYFKRTHCDAVCLSAGGSIAYYPTKIPFHYKSGWMKHTDPFGELVKGCRDAGMIIVARVDPHSIRDDAAAAHPEWVAVEAPGNKRRHWAAPERWVTCALGPYNFEFTTGVIREIVSLYKVDGVFANRWQGSGMCYCDSCRRLFEQATSLNLERVKNAGDADAREAWRKWRHDRLLELWDVGDDAISRVNPDACLIANAGGGAASDFDMVTIAAKSSMLAADRQTRDSRLTPCWINGRNGKEYRAAAGLKPVVGIFAIGRDSQYRWKDAVQQSDEIRTFAHDGIAQGLRPWYTKFAGQLWDKRWVSAVEGIYDWHWRNEAYLRNTENLARVAIVLSQTTARYYRSAGRQEDHELGFHQAMVESRIPFEMIHENLLDRAHLEKFKLLVLPNIACMSEAQCSAIREFVGGGGSVVAAFETSLYDERGRRRSNFGLAQMFGVRYAGRVDTAIKNSYMRIDAATKHPVIRGLEDAGRIINTTARVHIERVAEMPLPVTLVPSYPDLPMEEVYPRQPVTNLPDLCLGESKRGGRVAYFPGDIGRTFSEILDGDHLTLLRNAIVWAANEDAPAIVTGRGVLDIAYWRQRNSVALHLVNLTNPMMMKGPVRSLWPAGAQSVRLRLPRGAGPKSVRLLTAGRELPHEFANGVVSATVPEVLLHEVIAVDLA